MGRGDHRHAEPGGWLPGCGSSSGKAAASRAQLRFTGHRRSPVHLLRHQHHRRTAARPGTTPPAQGAVRGPDPLRQGHRSPEPAASCTSKTRGGWLEITLKGFTQNQIWCEIAPGLRAARVDADDCPTGPGRRWNPNGSACGSSPSPGASSAAGAPAAAPGRTLAIDRPDHRSDHPAAGTPWGLTSQNRPQRPGRKTRQGPWNPAHPARQPGTRAQPGTENSHQPMPQATRPRSRKIEARAYVSARRASWTHTDLPSL